MEPETFFPQLREHYRNEFPFVVYGKPGRSEITAFLQQGKDLHITVDYSETGFVFAPFDSKKAAVLIPAESSEKLETTHEPVIQEGNGTGQVSGATGSEARQKHMALVEKALMDLEKGELEKVVLSRQEEVDLKEEDPLVLFQDLRRAYPGAFVYCWFHPQVGLWLGATPETLIKMEGNAYQTMALAGTQRFRGDLDVEWGKKEQQEQQYVTDAILSNLTELNGGAVKDLVPSETIRTSRPYTARAGSILHLRTDITGRLKSTENLREIIHSLHPTPAVCGLPTEKARSWILKEEGYDREFYTGFLGELNLQQVRERSGNRRNVENQAYVTVKKHSNLFVNLRCMKIHGAKAKLFIGGGITADSVAQDEWEETVSKAQTMKRVLLK